MDETAHWEYDHGQQAWRCRHHSRIECLACDLDEGVERKTRRLAGPPPSGASPAKSSRRVAGKKLSAVGIRSEGGLQCPKCGSTGFKAKRSLGGKLLVGVLAPKTRVRCIACGTEYRRG